MYKNFFLQLIQRVATESPRFFKIIQWAAAILAIACGVITWLLAHGIWQPTFSDSVQAICSAAWPILTAVFLTSRLPVPDQTPTINTK